MSLPGKSYLFRSTAAIKAHVANVTNPRHLSSLLAIPEGFREYADKSVSIQPRDHLMTTTSLRVPYMERSIKSLIALIMSRPEIGLVEKNIRRKTKRQLISILLVDDERRDKSS